MRRLLAGLLAIALVVSACGSTSPSNGSGEPPSSQPASSSEASGPGPSGAGTTVPSASDPGPSSPSASAANPEATLDVGPWPAGWPAFPGITAPEPDTGQAVALPQPSIEEAFSIGEALYDPARVPAAVVSLLARMGVGIYAADGTALRPGDERDADDLWLTETEVRGLIEMGVADAEVGYEDGGGPFTFRDLAKALQPLLPTWSAAKLAAAYDDAYATHPDDFVPLVMLGQPIMPGTPLTRVQLWLLYVDGFVGPSTATAPGPGWGSANALLPEIPSPVPAMSAQEFALLLAHVAVVGWTIPFDVSPSSSSAHEGHEQAGPSITATARIDQGAVAANILVSPLTGDLLLGPRSSFSPNGSVTWTSTTPSLLEEHGTVSGALGVPMTLGSTGQVSIGFDVRQEPADHHADVVTATADLTASIPLADLVSAVYDLPAAARGFVIGTRQASAAVRLAWHAREGIDVLLLNIYDHTLFGGGVDLAFGGSARAHGEDAAFGFLEKQADGNYRGTILARSIGEFNGEWGGGSCTVLHDGNQELYVVGRPISGGNLQLAFYPASILRLQRFPSADCPLNDAWRIGFEGGGPDNRPRGEYILFGNARWTNPTIGYSVWLPSAAQREWVYQDDGDWNEFGTSLWRVRTRYRGP